MLFDGDLSALMTQWQERLQFQTPDYKIAVRDCIYDLKTLMDKQFADEIFEQQLKEDAEYYMELEKMLIDSDNYAA